MTTAGYMKKGILGIICCLVGCILSDAQQSCDVSAWTQPGTTVTVYFSFSDQNSSVDSVPSTLSDSMQAQGQAALSYTGVTPDGTLTFYGLATGTASASKSISLPNQSVHGSAQGSFPASNPSPAPPNVGDFHLYFYPSSCTFKPSAAVIILGSLYGQPYDSEFGGGVTYITPDGSPCTVQSAFSSGQASGTANCSYNIAYPPPSTTTISGTGSLTWSTSPLTSSASLQVISVMVSQGEPLTNNGNSFVPLSKVPVLLNRDLVVQVKAKLTGTLPASVTSIKAHVSLGVDSVDPVFKISDLTGSSGAIVHMFPTDPGDNQATVSLDTGAGVAITAGDPANTVVNLKPVASNHTVKFLFVNASLPGYTVSASGFSNMKQLTDWYLRSVFPLDSKYIASTDVLLTGSTLPNLCGLPSYALMRYVGYLYTVCDLAFMAENEGADRVVGITAPTYIPFASLAGAAAIGVSRYPLHGALVSYGFPENAAHELMHTYAGYVPFEDNCSTSDDASAVQPYWLQEGKSFSALPNYMCGWNPSSSSPSQPTPDTFFSSTPAPLQWGTTYDWSYLVGRVNNGSSDPEVLIVGGYVDQQGRGYLGGSFRSPSGRASQGTGGAYSIRLLDSGGAIVSGIPFTPNFTDSDSGGATSPYSPFVFSLVYPSGASVIQLLNGTSVVASQNIASGLLLTAVQNLEDGTFSTNPIQHRTALLNMVNAFNQQLAAGNVTGAQQFLINGIEPRISSWLSGSYVAPNPLFYTKASLLSLVNELAQRLSAAP